MISTLTGLTSTIQEKSIVLNVAGIGFSIFVVNSGYYSTQTTTTLFTYLHWNQEHGPSLYGFTSEIERTVFLLIIECSKIGPSIALSILSQISVNQFLEIITAGNHTALTKLHGIGSKKAEQIVVELKHKVQKLLSTGNLKIEQQQTFVQWQQLTDVLISLNYTRQESANAVQYVAEKYSGENYSLEQLIRSSLGYLSSKKA